MAQACSGCALSTGHSLAVVTEHQQQVLGQPPSSCMVARIEVLNRCCDRCCHMFLLQPQPLCKRRLLAKEQQPVPYISLQPPMEIQL